MPQAAAAARIRSRALVGLGLLVVSVWILLRHSGGLESDSRLYTLLALAHLHPESLGSDAFARLTIQDHYTVFSPLYAAAIRLWGMEPAAALLTLATHVGFCVCSWFFARRFMTADRVLLGLGLLLALPNFYGASDSIQVFENFITPRQPAEALVIAGLAAVCGQRLRLAALCMAGAFVLHPIIASGGIVLWLCWRIALRRPYQALLLAVAGVMLLADLALCLHTGPFARIDADWLLVLRHRVGYLFPTLWSMSAWGLGAVPLAVLVTGALTAAQVPLRRLCAAAAVTAVCGVLFATLGGDLLDLVWVTQFQSWRWLWLSGYLGLVFLPVIVPDCWRRGLLGRAAVLLLLAALLGLNDARALPLALLACACAAVAGRAVPRWLGAAVQAIAGFLLAAGVLLAAWNLHVYLRHAPLFPFVHGRYAIGLEYLQQWSHLGTVPAVALVLAWWVYGRAGVREATVLTALAALVCLLLLPFGWATWTEVRYAPDQIAAFATWRRVIPPDAEVLWPDETSDVWFLLQRPSFWSLDQMAGQVFSRELAALATQREAQVLSVMPWLRHEKITFLSSALEAQADAPVAAADDAGGGAAPTAQWRGLAAVCRLPGLRFFVSWNRLGPTPYEPILPRADHPDEPLYLYRCDAL